MLVLHGISQSGENHVVAVDNLGICRVEARVIARVVSASLERTVVIGRSNVDEPMPRTKQFLKIVVNIAPLFRLHTGVLEGELHMVMEEIQLIYPPVNIIVRFRTESRAILNRCVIDIDCMEPTTHMTSPYVDSISSETVDELKVL
jgi:hypothetical protein